VKPVSAFNSRFTPNRNFESLILVFPSIFFKRAIWPLRGRVIRYCNLQRNRRRGGAVHHQTPVMSSSLRRRPLAKSFIVTVLAIGGCGNVLAQQRGNGLPHSMKGYELYSWQARGQWYFSLVVGTNRQKTFAEIAAPRSRIKGLAELKRKLDLLPKGEDLIWSARRMPKTKLPPKTIVDEIIAYCRDRGLNLRVG
jgi:hypothetical protein